MTRRWPICVLLVVASACTHTTSGTLSSGGSVSPPVTSVSPPASPTPAGAQTPGPSFRPAKGSGIEGKVQAGPTCPVERPDRPCPPRPVSTDVTVKDRSDHVVARTHSGDDGRFSVGVEPGDYVVSANSGGKMPTCRPMDVTVFANRYSTITITCDTGIR